jgi:transcriptional regulator with XRE-family HTH domain
MELSGRLKWLRKRFGLSSKSAAAEALNIKYGTYQRYEYGGQPSRKNYKIIADYYKCSLPWLITGEGEPFPGEAASRHDVDGPDPAPPHREEAPASAEARRAPIEFRISDALAMTARVLESRTSYATALYLNIVHFDRAVSSESIVSKCEEDLRAQGELLTKMQARLDDLENQNKTLTQEIRELKGVSGDCPPIALGLESAAPTGTDEKEP